MFVMKLKLSDNEVEVLKLLIENGRVHCTEIAKKLDITPQAVSRIQKKLEDSGIIRGYSSIVDYEKLGIGVFAIALLKSKSDSWGKQEEDAKCSVRGPHLISVYRVPEGDVTHIAIYGFRSLEESDSYFHALQTERGCAPELKKVYILSTKSILKDSPKELLLKVICESDNERLARPETPKTFKKSK